MVEIMVMVVLMIIPMVPYRWANVLGLFCIIFIKYNGTHNSCSLVGVVIDQGDGRTQ